MKSFIFKSRLSYWLDIVLFYNKLDITMIVITINSFLFRLEIAEIYFKVVLYLKMLISYEMIYTYIRKATLFVLYTNQFVYNYCISDSNNIQPFQYFWIPCAKYLATKTSFLCTTSLKQSWFRSWKQVLNARTLSRFTNESITMRRDVLFKDATGLGLIQFIHS